MSHGGSQQSLAATPKEHFQIIAMLTFLIFGYLLGVYGYYNSFVEHYGHANLTDCFYDALGLFEFKMEFHEHIEIPLSLEIGRWLVAVSLLWAGIKLIYAILSNYIRLWLISIFQKHKAIVIFGATKISYQLALNLIEKKKHKLIIVDSNANNHYLEALSSRGAVFIVGSPNDNSIIKKSLANHASSVLCMTEDDSLNIEIFKMLKSGNAYVHINNRTLNDTFGNISSAMDIKKTFNIHSNAARKLFLTNPLNEHIDTTIPGNQVKIAIIGDGNLAKEIIFHALNLASFYNGSKLNITIVSDAMAKTNNHLLYTLDLDSNEIKKYFDISYMTKDDYYKSVAPYNHVIIAEEDQTTSLIDMVMNESKFKKYISLNPNQTVVISMYTLDSKSAPARTVQFNNSTLIMNNFGSAKSHFTEDVIIDSIWDNIASYNNDIYNLSHPDSTPTKFTDLSILAQDSNRALADHIVSTKYHEFRNLAQRQNTKQITIEEIRKLYSDNLTTETPIERIQDFSQVCESLSIKDIHAFAKAEHARWNIFHITRGWRTQPLPSDFRKNEDLKLHVCIVDWDELDKVSHEFNRDFKIDDIEAIFRIPYLHSKYSIEK